MFIWYFIVHSNRFAMCVSTYMCIYIYIGTYIFRHVLHILCWIWCHKHVGWHEKYIFLYAEHNVHMLHTVFLNTGIYIYFYCLQLLSLVFKRRMSIHLSYGNKMCILLSEISITDELKGFPSLSMLTKSYEYIWSWNNLPSLMVIFMLPKRCFSRWTWRVGLPIL